MNSNSMPTSFGWIGLGAMGFPMAMQLCKKLPESSTMYVFDINEETVRHFIEERKAGLGAKSIIATCSREVAENAEFIITIVPEGSHVKDVYLTPTTGILSAPNLSKKIFVDSSTIDIATSLQVASAINKLKYQDPPIFFDAPVSGGTPAAANGTLTFMLGASANHPKVPILKQILSTMGTNIHCMGGPSLGLAAKLSNNYLSGMIALATAEAMNLGMRLGLDPKILSDCFQTSSGASWVNATVNPVPGVCPSAVTSRGYEGGFKVQLMKKDMGLAVEAASEVGAKLVLADAGLAAYTSASNDPRCINKDSRVIYRWLGGVEPEVPK